LQTPTSRGAGGVSRLLRTGLHQKRVELKHTATLGRCDRIAEIDSINHPNELDTERDAVRNRTKHVAKEGHPLRLIELGRTHVSAPAAHGDPRTAGRA
jgi:hypothetical protein